MTSIEIITLGIIAVAGTAYGFASASEKPKMRKLNKYDQIYQYANTGLKRELVMRTIDSTVNTVAFSGSLRLVREVGTSGMVQEVGGGPAWYIETQELKEEYERRDLLDLWIEIDIELIPTENLKKALQSLQF